MPSSPARIWASALVLAGIGGLLAAWLGSWMISSLIFALGVCAVASYPIAVRVRERRFDLIEPIVGGAVTLGLIFGLRPIAMLVAGSFALRGTDISAEFPFVAGLGFLGTLGFVAGYEWILQRQRATPRSTQPSPPPMDKRIAFGYIVVLAFLSVALFALHLSRLGTDVVDGLRLMVGGRSPELVAAWSGTTEYLSASPILAACAATLLGVRARWHLTPFQLAAVIVLVAYPVALFYLLGMRRFVIPSIGIPIVAWMLMRGWRPGRRLLLVAVPVAFLLLATLAYIRSPEARSEAGGMAAAFAQRLANPSLAINRFILGPDTGMFPALALEVRALRSPEDFFYGRATVGDLVLAPIPHIVFPSKPQTARDELLVRVFGAPCKTTVGGICDDFSIIGTFYQDFWIPGVALLMAIVGAASAALWGRWRRSPGDARLVVAAACWIVFVPIVFRAGFTPAIQWSLYFLLPCLIGAVLSTFPWGRGRAVDERPSDAL
jgi:hypothetical protein